MVNAFGQDPTARVNKELLRHGLIKRAPDMRAVLRVHGAVVCTNIKCVVMALPSIYRRAMICRHRYCRDRLHLDQVVTSTDAVPRVWR